MSNLSRNNLCLKITVLICACAIMLPCAGAQMAVDSFDGPVTQNEINSFKSYIQTLTPATDNIGNNWAQGHSGEQTKAMGLMYEITGDTAILDQMIKFCDAVLSERNDLAPAPVGQHVIWTGRIDPVWPNNTTTTPIGTGGEQGDPVGHLGNCARLILQTPSIWNTTVSIGDPHGYGAIYLARAKTFVAGADAAIDGHILKSLLDLSNQNRQYFSKAGPYQPGNAVPWNQQMMFNYGFQNLAVAHQILGDDPARVARYDGLVQTSMNWFFGQVSKYQDSAGNTAYNWGYSPSQSGGEDSNHGSLDCAGFSRAYASGRYGISSAIMTPFANMFVDVMIIGPQHYAGRVDGTDGTGHGAPTTYIRSGYLLLAEFRPDAYHNMIGADLTAGGTTGSIDQFSRFEWVKNRRAQGTQNFSLSISPASQTVIVGGSTTYTATVTPSNGFNGAVSLSVAGLPAGATGSLTPTSISGGTGSSTLNVSTSSSTPNGTYTLTISGTSGSLSHTATVPLVVNLPPNFSISMAPASQTVAAGNSAGYTATVTPSNGFNNAVGLSVSGQPTGASASFSPASITGGSGTSTLSVTPGCATAPGTYALTITSTSGSLTHTASVSLVVTALPDFSLSASPTSDTVNPGSGASNTITVSSLNGFNSSVSLNATGLPSGASVSFSPNSIAGSGTSTLSLTTSSSTPPGSYNVTIIGMATTACGMLSHSITIPLTVNTPPPPDFLLSASPSSQTVTAGSGTSYTGSVGALNGFSGSVSLSNGSLPAGVTASFNPTSVTGSGNSMLSVSTSASTAPGTYTLTITGTSGSLSHSATIPLVVNAVSTCSMATANNTWNGTAFPSHGGTFMATFDATPSVSGQNSAVGLSKGAQTAFSGFANIVAFATSGIIQARSGGSYVNSTVPFTGGVSYHFRLAINVTTHMYSVLVTPAGGSEQTVGTNFAFRTEQNTVTSLDHWGSWVNSSSSGTLQVCNFAVQ